MHKLLDDYLCKKYPKLFVDREKPMNQTCMCWGFSCENGWYYLIATLCANIQHYIDNHNEWAAKYGKLWEEEAKAAGRPIDPKWTELVPQVVVDQVKEKFGTLRFYYHGGDDNVKGMVRLAESLSGYICETCGTFSEDVTQNSDGWIRTTCSHCVKEGQAESHAENLDKELVEIWKKIHSEPPLSENEKMNVMFEELNRIKSFGKEKKG